VCAARPRCHGGMGGGGRCVAEEGGGGGGLVVPGAWQRGWRGGIAA